MFLLQQIQIRKVNWEVKLDKKLTVSIHWLERLLQKNWVISY